MSWSQDELAAMVGVTGTTIGNIESGYRTNYPTLEKVAHALGVGIEELYTLAPSFDWPYGVHAGRRYPETAQSWSNQKPNQTVSDSFVDEHRSAPLIPIGAGQRLPERVIVFDATSAVSSEDARFYAMVRIEPWEGNPFFVDVYPVTVSRFTRFMSGARVASPSIRAWESPELHPVTNIPVVMMRRFAEWAGKALPSWSQWRSSVLYRADQGDSSPLAALDLEPILAFQANFASPTLCPVDAYGPQVPSGLCDVFGNAAEVVEDDLGYSLCGGSRSESIEQVRRQAAQNGGLPRRRFSLPSQGLPAIGFRCVASIQQLLAAVQRGGLVFEWREATGEKVRGS